MRAEIAVYRGDTPIPQTPSVLESTCIRCLCGSRSPVSSASSTVLWSDQQYPVLKRSAVPGSDWPSDWLFVHIPVFCKERRPFWFVGFSCGFSRKSIISVPTTCSKTESTRSATANFTNIADGKDIWAGLSADDCYFSYFSTPVASWINLAPVLWSPLRVALMSERWNRADAAYISWSSGVIFDEGVKQVLSFVVLDQSQAQTSTSKVERRVRSESSLQTCYKLNL